MAMFSLGADVDETRMDRQKLQALEENARQFFEELLSTQLKDGTITLESLSESKEHTCQACPKKSSSKFPSFQSLINHAKTFKKKNWHIHRGYARALEAFRKEHMTTAAEKVEGGASDRVQAAGEVVWPPAVVVFNTFRTLEPSGKWASLGKQQLPKALVSRMEGKGKYKPVYNNKGHRGMGFIVFGGEENGEGYRHAQDMAEFFFAQGKGLSDWERLTGGRKDEAAWQEPHKRGIRDLYGYMARREDVEFFDPRKQFCKDWKIRPLEEVKNLMKKRQREGDDEKETKMQKLQHEKEAALEQLQKREQEKVQAEQDKAKALEDLKKEQEKYKIEASQLQEQILRISVEQKAAEKKYEQKVAVLNAKMEQINRESKEEREKFRHLVAKVQAARQEEMQSLEDGFKDKEKLQQMDGTDSEGHDCELEAKLRTGLSSGMSSVSFSRPEDEDNSLLPVLSTEESGNRSSLLPGVSAEDSKRPLLPLLPAPSPLLDVPSIQAQSAAARYGYMPGDHAGDSLMGGVPNMGSQGISHGVMTSSGLDDLGIMRQQNRPGAGLLGTSPYDNLVAAPLHPSSNAPPLLNSAGAVGSSLATYGSSSSNGILGSSLGNLGSSLGTLGSSLGNPGSSYGKVGPSHSTPGSSYGVQQLGSTHMVLNANHGVLSSSYGGSPLDSAYGMEGITRRPRASYFDELDGNGPHASMTAKSSSYDMGVVQGPSHALQANAGYQPLSSSLSLSYRDVGSAYGSDMLTSSTLSQPDRGYKAATLAQPDRGYKLGYRPAGLYATKEAVRGAVGDVTPLLYGSDAPSLLYGESKSMGAAAQDGMYMMPRVPNNSLGEGAMFTTQVNRDDMEGQMSNRRSAFHLASHNRVIPTMMTESQDTWMGSYSGRSMMQEDSVAGDGSLQDLGIRRLPVQNGDDHDSYNMTSGQESVLHPQMGWHRPVGHYLRF